MPVTPFKDVVGRRCEMEGCTNWATHIYGTWFICCDCHAGPEDGLVSNDDMDFVNTFYQTTGHIPNPSDWQERKVGNE